METRDEATHLNAAQASGGTTGHGVRYVLFFGLLLAIGALSLIWIIPALAN